MEMKALLQSVQAIKDKYDAIYKSNGSYFNIFDITNISTDEVRICRIIKELIDPNGTHYQGDAYLRLFSKYVLNIENDCSNSDYATAVVQRELVIKNNRRIDLFIEIGDMKIPIEVKLYAGDQQNQCSDYFNYAKNSKIYYLTLDGHEPSDYSIGKLSKKHIQPISFQDEIILWLEECLKLPATIRVAPIREIILQLIDILKTLTNQSREGIELDIKELLLSSKENLQNADLITKAAKLAEDELKEKILQALDEQIEQTYSWKRLHNSLDFKQRTKKDNPAINYLLLPLPEPGFELWFRIEIDYRDLFAGFFVTENQSCTAASIKAAKKFNSPITTVKMRSPLSSASWNVWRPLANSKPNFQDHDDTYYSLLDDQAFASFIATVMADIDEILKGLLPPYRDTLANVLDK